MEIECLSKDKTKYIDLSCRLHDSFQYFKGFLCGGEALNANYGS